MGMCVRDLDAIFIRSDAQNRMMKIRKKQQQHPCTITHKDKNEMK